MNPEILPHKADKQNQTPDHVENRLQSRSKPSVCVWDSKAECLCERKKGQVSVWEGAKPSVCVRGSKAEYQSRSKAECDWALCHWDTSTSTEESFA